MEANLIELADKLGIARSFSDAGMSRKDYEVSEDIVKFFCSSFGYNVNTPEAVNKSLQRLEEQSWKKAIDEILVLRHECMRFCLTLPDKDFPLTIKLTPEALVENANQRERAAVVMPFVFDVKEKKTIGRRAYTRFDIVLEENPAFGYYVLEIVTQKETYRTLLACVPGQCYSSEAVECARLWGYSVQLYALRSRRNWGVGDFTDLKEFVKLCACAGADVIGLNPLNVLFHDYPENASPYSSISRLFLNPIYIDVEQVPGFDSNIKIKFQNEIKAAKKSELIDYTAVYGLKIKALHEVFAKAKKSRKYMADFADYKNEKGWDLDLLATYQALYNRQSQTVWGGWRAWEKDLQNPHSLAVAQFKSKHEEEIEFFEFLQFEANRQLEQVYNQVRQCGLKIGLYRDLPVGVCKDSAELWADQYAFMQQSGAGAPPDAFFPCGQKWCLGAFNPFELKKRAYEPYLKILRANMAYAGALRIDHVMGLMRLFMIPDAKNEGTYVSYNFEDMLGLLALESHMHKCVVVGESIGNVPDGFMDKLHQYRIYSISVLWAERWNGGYGDFKMPCDYPADAFVSVGTHDMPPLKMWWFGYEIELMHKLNMLSDEERYNAYKRREQDRKMLLAALDYNNTWSADNRRQGDYLYGEAYPEGIDEAVHRLVSNAASKVVMVQLEDIFQVDRLQNLPGTDRDKYPNWRLRLPLDLEDFENSEAYQRHISILSRTRC